MYLTLALTRSDLEIGIYHTKVTGTGTGTVTDSGARKKRPFRQDLTLCSSSLQLPHVSIAIDKWLYIYSPFHYPQAKLLKPRV